MYKRQLDPARYLDALNAELRTHEYFQSGMAFIAYPEGSVGLEMSGYSVTGPYTLMGVYADVAHKVAGQYSLIVE